MSISLNDICLINVFLMLGYGLFSLVGKIKTTNQNKPCCWVRNWSKYSQITMLVFKITVSKKLGYDSVVLKMHYSGVEQSASVCFCCKNRKVFVYLFILIAEKA